MALFTTVCWALSLLLMWKHSVECKTRERVCTTLAHEKVEVPWLERSCHSDADCTDSIHAECFKGKCLCTLGYYYSNGQDVCVDNCPVSDQQAEFLTYPGIFLSGHGYAEEILDVDNQYVDNLVDCLAACAVDARCVVMEFDIGEKGCSRNSVSPLADTSKFIRQDSYASLYQQRCK